MIDHALRLASLGFHVFPIKAGAKAPPLIEDFPNRATRDEEQVRLWWTQWPAANVGISTTHFEDDKALLVVDVDNKGNKHGDDELLRLELEGREMPETLTQRTPGGGRHLVYRCDAPVRQGTDVLGVGLDVRSGGGYIVGEGSAINGAEYTANDTAVIDAPEWLIEACGKAKAPVPVEPAEPAPATDSDAAIARGVHYLEHEAPLAVEGESGDATTFKVAARLKDLALSEHAALRAMENLWNDRCSPPWSGDELARKVANAYKYGTEKPGAAAPEVAFPPDFIDALRYDQAVKDAGIDPKLHPFDILNKDHAYVIAGGGDHIIWETTDHTGQAKLDHLAIGVFHRKHEAWTMNVGKRDQPVTEMWMGSPRRRSYDGMVFMPERTAPSNYFNLWRGFAVEPLGPDETPTKEMSHAVESFFEHAHRNVCGGNDSLFRWLKGYFAHLVQKPWEKPLVALVFRGGKGVGKNALVERIGSLLGQHFLLSSNRRYLVSNFTGHLENCLMFALDEAFWSGDKQAEGQLKDLITGKQHVIEHKGKETFTVDNLTRVAIIGNEEWLVPSSHDERRFAVFDVGDGRKQDRRFFERMRTGMESGGSRLLLRDLLAFDISGLDLNEAPQTEGLLDQKHATLEPFQQWWLDCLTEGKVLAGDFDTAWPGQVECERFRAAFRRYVRERNIRSRIPEDKAIGKSLKKIGGGLIVPSKARSGDGFVNIYRLPDLKDARGAWDKYIGHTCEWPAE